MCKGRLETLRSLLLSDKYQTTGIVRTHLSFVQSVYYTLPALGSPYLHVREQSTHIHTPFRKEKGRLQERSGIPRGPTTQCGPLHRSSPPVPPDPPHSRPTSPTIAGVRLLRSLSLLPCSSRDAVTAPPGALPLSSFPPPSLGSRKTRSELAPSGGACSVASRFSSLVGSPSATPASAAAAAAPQGSQIPQQRPRAFPLPH